jgi:hypothetical protein
MAQRCGIGEKDTFARLTEPTCHRFFEEADTRTRVRAFFEAPSRHFARSIALPPMLAEELWQWRRRTNYRGDGDRVFCFQESGGVYRPDWFKGRASTGL